MGQAKQRGTFEQRQAVALARPVDPDAEAARLAERARIKQLTAQRLPGSIGRIGVRPSSLKLGAATVGMMSKEEKLDHALAVHAR